MKEQGRTVPLPTHRLARCCVRAVSGIVLAHRPMGTQY
jgi:hypothetical protein